MEKIERFKENLYEDATRLSTVLDQLKAHSARASARSAIQPSRPQSRALSPTNSNLTETRDKLKIVPAQRTVKKELDETMDKIKKMEIEKQKNEETSSSANTEDSESDSTLSETEDKVFKLPTKNRNKEREKKEQGYYEFLMKLKRTRFPGKEVCPEAECEITHTREEQMAKHILSQYSNTTHANKAKEDILRIKTEKKKRKKDREDNKEEREKKKEEA